MAYADVNNPVIINVSRVVSTVISIDNYVRRMAIVDTGQSDILVGEYKIVTKSNYETELFQTKIDANNSNYKNQSLYKAVKQFFTYAYTSDRELLVFNVGTLTALTNPIATQVQTLDTFITNEFKRSYIYLVPQSWYYPEPKKLTLVSNLAVSGSYADGVSEGLTFNLTTTCANGSVDEPKLADSSVYTATYTKIDTGYSVQLTRVTAPTAEGSEDTTLSFTVTSTPNNSVPTKPSVTYEVQVTATSANNAESVLETSYSISFGAAQEDSQTVTEEGERDLAFSSLAAKYSDLNAGTYFFIEGTAGVDPSTDAGFALYKGQKSVQVFYNNDTTFVSGEFAAAVLGIIGSTKFDISDEQQSSPLNYTKISGANPKLLSKTLKENLLQAPVTYLGTLASNAVILNGLQADGTAWDYYHNWDTMSFNLDSAIQTLMFNSANSKTSQLQYTQLGLEVLKATIKASLIEGVELGIIDSFSASYNEDDGTTEGDEDITMVDFSDYVASYPENYSIGKYDGISFYIVIGKFIRQVVLDIQIN